MHTLQFLESCIFIQYICKTIAVVSTFTDMSENLAFILIQMLPDGGGSYAETNFSRLIVEPWNAFSSLAFLLPVFYWLIKLKGNYQKYSFLTFCLLLLLLGGVGSTLFHAFRVSPFFLLLDILPMLLLTIVLSIYFWIKILPKGNYVFAIILLYVILQYFLFNYVPRPTSINIAYFVRGIMMFLPAVLLIYKTHFENGHYIIIAVLFFILALLCRSFDKQTVGFLYMGSHWLWHILTAIGSFYLAEFLYLLEKSEVEFLEEEDTSFIEPAKEGN